MADLSVGGGLRPFGLTPIRAAAATGPLAAAAETTGLSFDQQRARQFMQQVDEGYNWTWNPGAEAVKTVAKGETTKDVANAARNASTSDETGKLIRLAENLQGTISLIDATLADGKATDKDKLEAERADALSGLQAVVSTLRAKARLPVTNGDIQRAADWATSWEPSYPAVSGFKAPAKPKATGGLDDFKGVNSSSSIGELLRAEAGLFGLYHREQNAANRDEAKRRVEEVEGWIRAKQASGDVFEAARAQDWVRGYQAKNWTLGPAADAASKPKTGNELEEVRKAIGDLSAASSVGQIIRAHDAAYYLKQSFEEGKGSAADISELKSLMAKAKMLTAGKAGGPAGFERERAKEWRDSYSSTYEAPKPAAKTTASKGSLDELKAVDGSSSFGSLVRSLAGLNGLYHRNLTDADGLEAKGEKDKAKALRDEADKARGEFDRVLDLLRGKTGSSNSFERTRAEEWFKTPHGFVWDHKKAEAGKPADATTPADYVLGASDPVGKMIAKYQALYGIFQAEQVAYAKDSNADRRTKADKAKADAESVLALISGKR